jgi:hypothetical protein
MWSPTVTTLERDPFLTGLLPDDEKASMLFSQAKNRRAIVAISKG